MASKKDDFSNYFQKILEDEISSSPRENLFSENFSPTRSKPINEKIDEAARRKKLENDSTEQDIKLKRNALTALFVFLALETLVFFVLTFFQGLAYKGFILDEVSFRILATSTILQVSFMLKIAINHLFPTK